VGADGTSGKPAASPGVGDPAPAPGGPAEGGPAPGPTGPLGLRPGQRASRTLTVTARHVELYAELTGDRNPLHFDPAFAARTRFGRLVAQGGVTAGMLNALVAMDLPGPGTVFMSQALRYLAPAYLGDTLTAEVEVLALKPNKPVCQLAVRVTNQDGVRVLEGECWTYTLRPD
jgi:acyl dehydratase